MPDVRPKGENVVNMLQSSMNPLENKGENTSINLLENYKPADLNKNQSNVIYHIFYQASIHSFKFFSYSCCDELRLFGYLAYNHSNGYLTYD